MNIKKTNVAASVLAAAYLAGCTSSTTELYAEKQAERQAIKEEKAQESFKNIPDWFLNPPVNDESGIYAVGTSTSDNLQFSLNMAKLNSKFSMAKAFNQEVAGRERSYTDVNSSGNVSTNAESVVVSFIDKKDIVGVETVETKAELVDGKYTVYTLMHLSYEEQAKIIASKMEKATDTKSKIAYAEIEQELLRRANAQKSDATVQDSSSNDLTPIKKHDGKI